MSGETPQHSSGSSPKDSPVALGRKVVAYFGKETAAKIEEDPYRLLSFAASWKSVDSLAVEAFGIEAFDDPRRAAGGVEEALSMPHSTADTRASTGSLSINACAKSSDAHSKRRSSKARSEA